MASEPAWRSDEFLAFTEHDGPGRPPPGAQRLLWCTLAGVLGVVVTGVIATNALFPEHRLWASFLGVGAIVTGGGAAAALIRGSASAPVLALAAAVAGLAGLAVGAIDTGHDVTRGRLILVAFGVATVVAAWICLYELGPWRWARSVSGLVDRDMRAAAALEEVETGAVSTGPANEPLSRRLRPHRRGARTRNASHARSRNRPEP